MYTEELYTLEEAKQIIKAEQSRKREDLLYNAKQKIMGIILILISVIIPVLFHDATATVILLPLGIAILLTKEKVFI